jgi:hypothetical protein
MRQLIILTTQGQLANRLLFSAQVMAYAIENGFSVSNIPFCEYAKYFKGTYQDIFCRFPTQKSAFANNLIVRRFFRSLIFIPFRSRPPFKEKLTFKFFKKDAIILHEPEWDSDVTILSLINKIYVIDLQSNTSTAKYFDLKKHEQHYLDFNWLMLMGWRFSTRTLLHKHSDQIREYFSPLDMYSKNVDNLMLDVKNDSEIIIGVHIRRGDYEEYRGGRYFFSFEEYASFMNSLINQFPCKKVKFLICSNENLKNISEVFSKFSYHFGTGHLVEDLYALARCDYLIGPPSTYTTWASFYGQVPLFFIEEANPEINLDKFQIYQGYT